MAEADNAKIKWIFITHFHADFVSGQVDLAKKTGATIFLVQQLLLNMKYTKGKMAKCFQLVISI